MAEMTLDQKKAIAMASARLRLQAQQTPAQQEYNSLPWYGKAAQAADDTVRMIANGMTLGYADKFAGYMGGEGADAERAKSQAARERAGSAGTAAEIVGAMLPASRIAKGAQALGLGGKTLATRTASMAGQGSLLGAGQAMGNDQDVATGAAIGAAAGGAGNLLGEALMAGGGKVAGLFNPKQKVMNADELKAAGSAAFKQAKDAGVVFNPQAIDRLRQTVYKDMAEFGYHPQLQPGAAVAYNELERLIAGGNVSMEGLQAVRKMASQGYNPLNRSNNELIGRIIGQIDDFAETVAPGDLVTGNAAVATDALSTARDYWSRFRKLEAVQELIEKAKTRAGSTGSGGNVENATRQNLRKILDNKKLMRGFTPDEIAAIRTAVLGTGPQNALRLVGKLSPQGNGLMAALGLGGAFAAPQFAIPAMIAGAAAKKGAESMTNANARAVERLIASGGQASLLGAPPNAAQRIMQQYQPLLGRAIMTGGLVGAAGR